MNKRMLRQVIQTAGYKAAIVTLRLLLILVLIRNFKPSDYGAYSVIITIYTFGILISGLNLYSFLYRDGPGKALDTRMEVFKTTFLFEVGLTILIICSLSFNPMFLDGLLQGLKIAEYRSAFILGLILLIGLIAANELSTYLQVVLKIEQNNRCDFIIQALWVLPLLGLWYFNQSISVETVLWVNLLGVVLGLAYGFRQVEFKALLSARFNRRILREGLLYSIPLIVPAVSVTALRSGDRLILSYYRDLHEVGLYSFAYTFLNTLYTFSAAVILSTMLPYIVAAHNLGNHTHANHLMLNAFKFSIFSFGIGTLGLILFAHSILGLLARPEYLEACRVLPLLAFGYFNIILGYPAHFVLLLQRRTVTLMWVDFFGFVIGMSLNFLLIPKYSYQGAAWAMAIAFGLVSVIKIYYAKLWQRFNLLDFFSLKTEWHAIKHFYYRNKKKAILTETVLLTPAESLKGSKTIVSEDQHEHQQ